MNSSFTGIGYSVSEQIRLLIAINCASFVAIANHTIKFFFSKRFFNYVNSWMSQRFLFFFLWIWKKKTVIMITRNKMNRSYIKYLPQLLSPYLFTHCTFMIPGMLIFVILTFFILLQRAVNSTVLEISKSYFFVNKIIFSKGSLSNAIMIYRLV